MLDPQGLLADLMAAAAAAAELAVPECPEHGPLTRHESGFYCAGKDCWREEERRHQVMLRRERDSHEAECPRRRGGDEICVCRILRGEDDYWWRRS